MIQPTSELAAVIITCATTLACALNYYIMSERIVALFGFYGAISLGIYLIADNQIGAFLIVTSAVVLSIFAFIQLMRVWKPGTELKLALLEIRLLRERLKDNLRIRERASHDMKQTVVLLVVGLFLSFFFSILEGLATAVAILAPLMVILRALEGVKLNHAEVKFPDLVSYEEWDGGWSKYSVYSELAWTAAVPPDTVFVSDHRGYSNSAICRSGKSRSWVLGSLGSCTIDGDLDIDRDRNDRDEIDGWGTEHQEAPHRYRLDDASHG